MPGAERIYRHGHAHAFVRIDEVTVCLPFSICDLYTH